MVILLMGVAGSGKSTVGRLLAAALGWQFEDADSYHSPENIEKMMAGIPLTDEDRRPWLSSLREEIRSWLRQGRNVVLACSALKQSYRDLLMINEDVKLVFLRGDFELVKARLAARHGHFVDSRLLRSQFETLEAPEEGVIVDVSAPPEAIVIEIRRDLNL